MRSEAFLTLDRFAPGLFSVVVGVDDVVEPKPAAEGLFKVSGSVHFRNIWYVGDSVDDARAARAARVPFIGIVAKDSPHRKLMAEALKSLGAQTILDDINAMDPKAYA
jgi:phosphoglycolate phosphatase-like HAD superfamily hydrolase